jgi:hypothetical protein
LKETKEEADATEDVCYEEPDLYGGIERVDYLISYGIEALNNEAKV